MSEIFRTCASQKHHAMTLQQLAICVHEAEETDNDISLLACFDELELRGGNRNSTIALFMEFYRYEWRKRMEARK